MDTARADLLAQIAVWYYEEGLDQEAIARRINRSRSLVSRLLEEARQAGLVEFRVNYPLKTDHELEQRLCQAFGLAHVAVLAQPPVDHNLLLRRLGELGARFLQQALHDHIRIGVGWGTGVHAVVRAMPFRSVAGATVVQIIGAVGYGDPMVDGAELGRWLAQKLGAAFHYLSAPLIVEDESVAQALRRERSIAEALALAGQVEVAVAGIGTVDTRLSSLLRAGYLSAAELADLARCGAVGDILAHQLDAGGQELDVPANRRVIGLSDLNLLRAIPRVIAVAGGVLKAPAILAALRGRYVNVLVTDAATAVEVLTLQ
ncbi:MAG TPA: sugar-binding transcriptional regulator [Anaerolineae bacterium]